MTRSEELSFALKEWAIAVEALTAGATILLLRKGGIYERGGRFQLQSDRALLYPTYEHQKPTLLKTTYSDRVEVVASGWHPETVELRSWAWVTAILPVASESVLDGLLPYHIWNATFARERWRWKPHLPLYLLLLRVFRLPHPVRLAYRKEYGGCRSWIELAEPIAIAGSQPILSDASYRETAGAIVDAVGRRSL